MKKICESKLNALIAYQKCLNVLAENPWMAGKVKDLTVHLRKVVLKTEALPQKQKRNPKDTPAAEHTQPFYGFVMHVGKTCIIVSVKSGKADAFKGDDVVSETVVTGRFEIDGIIYAKKDTVNGFVRYTPVADKAHKPRKKLRVNGPLATAAMEELHKY